MSEPSKPGGAPRVVSPQREQLEWRQVDLEGLIAEDHVARVLWKAVESLDLSEFYAGIAARESMPGRPTLDPKLLLGLWLLATRDGVGSARRLAQLCTQHHAYIWMCGGVQPNYHTLPGLSDGSRRQAGSADGAGVGIVDEAGSGEARAGGARRHAYARQRGGGIVSERGQAPAMRGGGQAADCDAASGAGGGSFGVLGPTETCTATGGGGPSAALTGGAF